MSLLKSGRRPTGSGCRWFWSRHRQLEYHRTCYLSDDEGTTPVIPSTLRTIPHFAPALPPKTYVSQDTRKYLFTELST